MAVHVEGDINHFDDGSGVGILLPLGVQGGVLVCVLLGVEGLVAFLVVGPALEGIAFSGGIIDKSDGLAPLGLLGRTVSVAVHVEGDINHFDGGSGGGFPDSREGDVFFSGVFADRGIGAFGALHDPANECVVALSA